jgi:hypothetical protein
MSTAAPIDGLGKVGLALLFGIPVLMLVMPGAFRLPIPLGIPLGLVFVWLSGVWPRREKVFATVLVGGLLALPFVILFLGFARDWGMGVLALLLLWPVAGLIGGWYLVVARRRRRREEA